MSAFGTKQTSDRCGPMSASLIGHLGSSAFRLPSLRCGCRSRARASLRNWRQALPSWGSRTRWNNLLVGLAVRLTGGSSGHCDLTSSIVPRGTSCHRTVELAFLLSDLIMYSSHAATASLLQRNSVPSSQMRCMMTARRRASATIAFFMPRRLAICIAQALSQDHCVERTSMIWAAS